MATVVRGSRDNAVDALKHVLEEYEMAHPSAVADLYRQNVASIRIRIVDARFEHMSKGDRHDEVFNFIADRITADVLQEVSVLLLLAPSEQASSFMNFEFDDPIPSGF